MPPKPRPLASRILRSSTLEERGYVTACMTWDKHVDEMGYGRINVAGKILFAHRVAYEVFVGPIPAHLELDHLCRQRDCVKPAHCEPVTRKENVRRGLRGRLITHCPQGHGYDEHNTAYTRRGHRYCKRCNVERARSWRANR